MKATTVKKLPLILILVTFSFRVYHLDYQSLWRDEVDAIRFSNPPFLQLDSFQSLGALLAQPGHNGPLYFIVLRGWRTLSGDSEFALRYLSLLAGVLTIPLLYQTGRKLGFSNPAALISGLLAATSPYLIWYSQEAKMYTWLVCLVLLAVYAYQSAFQSTQPSGWWTLFVIATSLSFYTHILAPLMIPVYGLWAISQWSVLRHRWRGWALSMSILTLPYVPLLWWQAPLFISSYDSGHPFYPFSKQFLLLLHLYSLGVLQFPFQVWGTLLTVLISLLGLLFHKCHHQSISLISRLRICIWFLLPVLLIYFISLRVQVFEDRYLIYILPSYLLLLALGIGTTAYYMPWLANLLLGLILFFNLRGVWSQATQVIKADFRQVAQYIAANEAERRLNKMTKPSQTLPLSPQPFSLFLPLITTSSSLPTILVQMPYLHHTLTYYFEHAYHPLDGLWTNDNRDPTVIVRDMRHLTQGRDHLWLVVAEESMWDRRQLVRQWLNNEARLVNEAHFAGVDVYEYVLQDEP